MIEKGASFSLDRMYRWSLYRSWGGSPRILFICLNASMADEVKDDPTVRRCIQFARDWGFKTMMIGNLFGLRSMDPKELLRVTDPVGAENNQSLQTMFDLADRMVYSWGNHGAILGRSQKVYEMFGPAWCFGINKSGEPVHPLYQRRDATLMRYERGLTTFLF